MIRYGYGYHTPWFLEPNNESNSEGKKRKVSKINGKKTQTSLSFQSLVLTGKCLTPTQLLICSSFSRENGYLLLICSSLSTSLLSPSFWGGAFPYFLDDSSIIWHAWFFSQISINIVNSPTTTNRSPNSAQNLRAYDLLVLGRVRNLDVPGS